MSVNSRSSFPGHRLPTHHRLRATHSQGIGSSKPTSVLQSTKLGGDRASGGHDKRTVCVGYELPLGMLVKKVRRSWMVASINPPTSKIATIVRTLVDVCTMPWSTTDGEAGTLSWSAASPSELTTLATLRYDAPLFRLSCAEVFRGDVSSMSAAMGSLSMGD